MAETLPSDRRRQPAGRGSSAVTSATTTRSTLLRLPGDGAIALPPAEHLAYYAAIGLLALTEVIEWPLAGVLIVGKMLADSRRSEVLREFGKALDEA